MEGVLQPKRVHTRENGNCGLHAVGIMILLQRFSDLYTTKLCCTIVYI